MRLLRRPEIRIVALVAIAAAAWLTVRSSKEPAPPPTPAASTSWLGLVTPNRPRVALGERYIVVLRTPSVSQRVAKLKLATEQAERRWTAEVFAAQQQVLTQLARHGLGVHPDYSYARVLDGFSSVLDPRAVALLEHNPEVAGVYPVRVAYPATIDASAPGGTQPGATLPGLDGTGITIALLDTGVDLSHPYLGGRVERGIDVVGGTTSAAAQPNPQDHKQVERHGTELAGVLAGSGGPDGLHGVAPGATVLPIRVAGWQRTAGGRDAVYARSDQVIEGLDRAVDPNGDGDTHDAVRIALIGVAEPFASFADSPEAQAVDGAFALDTLVVTPAGNDGKAGPVFGSIAGPGGSGAALVVGATDSRRSTSSVRVVFTQGPNVLAASSLPLLGSVAPTHSLVLPLAVPGPPGALKGKAALVPAGLNPVATVDAVVADGAKAVLVYGRALPAGTLGTVTVPVVGVPEATARVAVSAVRRRYAVLAALGRAVVAVNPEAGRVAGFSSRGLTFAGMLAPQLLAPGVGIETSDPGSGGDGEPAFTSVTGTSVAAASVAGAAVLLAEARPGLSAIDLASLLAGSAPSGAVDPGAAAVGEVTASATSLAFGPWNGRRLQQTRALVVHNVSSRRLVISLTPSSRLVSVRPASLVLPPDAELRVRVTARATSRPTLAVVTGTLALRPAGGQVLRVPWAIVFEPFAGSLLGPVRVTPTSFSPSDTSPAVLSVVAGRVSGGASVEIGPVARLDVLLYNSSGAFMGVLARARDLLPGAYRFALTGRGPGGAPLSPGSYEIRLVARPTLPGRPSRAKIVFRIE
jgi:subtilisin family serine protease